MATKAKAPARTAIEAMKPLVAELREIEKNLVGIEAQAAEIPREADEKVDKLLGGVYKKHTARLKALGFTAEDPCASDLREVLGALKTLATAFGVLLDTSALPRTEPKIWTADDEYYDWVDDKHVVLRGGLKLGPDGSVSVPPKPKKRLQLIPPLVW